MAEITAALVKELREKSGAGMMDCKKALVENDGDMEAAIDWLRMKGLAAAAKKSGRVAAEGLIAVATSSGSGAVIELNSETDFVARNPDFQRFAAGIAAVAIEKGGNFDATAATELDGGKTVQETVTEMIGMIGENLTFRRSAGITVKSGVVSSYVHSAVAPDMGKIGVIVGLESNGDKTKLAAFGKQLAMHIAATSPQWVSREDIEQATSDRERDILVEQAREEGKSEDIIQKMVDGRMRKYFEEVCLLEQTYVIDGETKVVSAVDAAGEDVGGNIKVAGFVRFQIGDGIEKEESDFAAEVAATAGG
ncbi:MAG: Elongation factor Ts [Alphaproteobacteria bacterium MarineAlpha11_Bin1]|nr:MAG: Elongation factor Ts [Alphaproteobacteria bacterium MarineAlpha11_Bin1]|tara:strand:- start:10583 stop:11506 length:924 start_codon:yes stop_codon:yes gene_type:complete